MAETKTSLFSRLMEGKEKDENYARSTLPTNRWQLFWDIVKGRFGKLIVVNLLTLIFFIPLIAIIILRMSEVSGTGAIGPYASSLGVGYPVYPDISGVWESYLFFINLRYFALIIPAAIIAAIGLSGGAYVIRNMIWTEGIFVANDFWRGIKKNFRNVLEAALFFSVFLFVTVTLYSLSDVYLAQGVTPKGWFVAAKISGVIICVVAGMMSLWMLSLGVNYKQGVFALIRNAFVMTFGTLPQTIFFTALALLPALLFFTGSSALIAVGMTVYVCFGFSYALLSWMSYTQWAFDKFVNPNVKGAKVGRGLYNPNAKKEDKAEDEASAIHAYKLAVIASGKSNLMSRPMKPIDDDYTVYELPQSFSREDLQKLKESKKAISDSQKEFEEEHKNDTRYVEYNKQFEEREKALQPEKGKNGKVKKVKPPKLLNE